MGGYYVRWDSYNATSRETKERRGLVYYHEQTKEITSKQKILIRIIDEDMQVTNESVLKTPKLCKIDVIGYFD